MHSQSANVSNSNRRPSDNRFSRFAATMNGKFPFRVQLIYDAITALDDLDAAKIYEVSARISEEIERFQLAKEANHQSQPKEDYSSQEFHHKIKIELQTIHYRNREVDFGQQSQSIQYRKNVD